MISDIKVNAKVGEWGPCLRFKSRILRNMFILKKGHQPGVYVPLRALFLVCYWFCHFRCHIFRQYMYLSIWPKQTPLNYILWANKASIVFLVKIRENNKYNFRKKKKI